MPGFSGCRLSGRSPGSSAPCTAPYTPAPARRRRPAAPILPIPAPAGRSAGYRRHRVETALHTGCRRCGDAGTADNRSAAAFRSAFRSAAAPTGHTSSPADSGTALSGTAARGKAPPINFPAGTRSPFWYWYSASSNPSFPAGTAGFPARPGPSFLLSYHAVPRFAEREALSAGPSPSEKREFPV